MRNILIILLVIISYDLYSQSKEAEILYYEGLLKQKNKDFVGAIEDFNKALELTMIDSVKLEIIMARADNKRFLKDAVGAISDYTKVLNLNSDDEIAHYCYKMRGNMKMEKEDYRGAILDFSKIIEKNKNDCEANYFRGLSYGSIENYSDAILDLNQAIRFCEDEKKARAYLFLGICWNALGDKETGCLNFSKAGELGIEEAYKKITEYCN